MATLINTKNCSAELKGTGIIDCPVRAGRLIGFLKVPKSYRFDSSTDDFDLTYVNAQAVLGNIVSFNDASDLVQNLEETVYKTYNSGIKSQVRNGLPELQFIYPNGYHFHSSAFSHNSYNTHDIILVFDNNLLGFGTLSDETTLKGLTMGSFQTSTIKFNDGAEPQETMISVQIINSEEYNQNISFIDTADFGFSVSEIKGAIDTHVSVIGTPASTETSVVIKVVANANRSISIAGLAATDFKVTGQTVSAAVYDSATQEYTLTVDALTVGTKKVSLKVNDTDVAVDVSGTLYSGSSANFTVA